MSDLLVSAFVRTAKDFGSHPAVVESNSAATYAELDRQSSEVAAALRKVGVTWGSRVGIYRRKDIDAVASIHGVLKAGAAYVPLDSRVAPNRLAAIISDANLAAIIFEPALLPKLQALSARGLTTALDESSCHGQILALRHPPADTARLEDFDSPPAYVLYTSGSTGPPKGVQHTHSSAHAFVSWAAGEFGIGSADRLSCHAPLHFDLTIFDLFAAAMTGACVVLIPDHIAMFPAQVASIIDRHHITTWYSVPFALVQLLKRGHLASSGRTLRQILFAGERYPPADLQQLATALPGLPLTNLFGPTETNVCTFHRLSGEDLFSDRFCPIGRLCPYSTGLVVDDTGAAVVPGAKGELLIGGASVMTGYLNRPELNEKVFTTRNEGHPQRFFRTGDLVTVSSFGVMMFHGRADRQVKVRGFRIELDEVEAALANCCSVNAAAAWIHQDLTGFTEIRAAVSLGETSKSPRPEALISEVKDHLPLAAVPAQVSILNDLPRTINGKVDYKALSNIGI
ncbi:MAG TPA: amino acid adenylation domain-containing protein [Bryobacteraceae bacterium]|nr:amino acid adenylation domain-containing protein [Bryobacteraceae bacterium]